MSKSLKLYDVYIPFKGTFKGQLCIPVRAFNSDRAKQVLFAEIKKDLKGFVTAALNDIADSTGLSLSDLMITEDLTQETCAFKGWEVEEVEEKGEHALD